MQDEPVKSRLRAVWESLHTSFWFVPTLIALAAMGLSVGTLEAGQRTDRIQVGPGDQLDLGRSG